MKPVFKNLLKACFILLSSYMFVTCQYSKKQPKNSEVGQTMLTLWPEPL